MTMFRAIFVFICVIYLSDEIIGQSDLRSALAAIDRRQKELADYEEQQYGYNPYDQQDNLAFLNNAEDGRGYDKDYLDDDSYEPLSKRLTSSFRERLEQDREKQMEEFARSLYNNLEGNGLPGGIDKNYLRELWERYYGDDLNYPKTALSKRYYPLYGVEDNGLKKRGSYLLNDYEPVFSIYHHVPRDDASEYQMNYPATRYLHEHSSYHKSHYPYGDSKRFLIAKRSSSYSKNIKRSVKKQTDPKVQKELNTIFGNQHESDIENNKLGEGVGAITQKPEEASQNKNEDASPPRKIEKKDRPKMDTSKDDLNKEIFAPVAPQNKQQIQLKKKSIDWSDYFGLDRRKKSDASNGLDKEWLKLMERYYKAIAITAKKRNVELPLESFHNLEASIKNDDPHGKNEQKINEIDKKLEKLEDNIVGDALKYTGAHQGEADSKEIQQIKDSIISRLAQAYNIEKMRNALEEYKLEIEKARKEVEKAQKEVENSSTSDKIFSDYSLQEKRVSVPRKEAIDDTRENGEPDNNIKCTTTEDCHEQNFKIPSDVLENHFSNLECPAIQRACNDVASVVGHYGHVFEPACTIHQMCLLCCNNSWFSPTRQCNMLFITKAFELCLGKEECKKEARRSLRYLLDINKSLQAQAALTDECEMQCPSADILSK